MHLNGLIQSANTLADGVVVGTAYGQDDSELFLQTNGAFSVEYTADGVKQATEAEFDSINMRFSATWKPDNGTATKIRGEFTTLTTNVKGTVGNNLTSLEFKRQNLITEIQVPNGTITTLDLSGCTQLATLNCSGNKISTLKLNTNSLKYFSCDDNALTAIDVSKNTALTYFNCGYNALTALDVSKNTALARLDCSYNKIDALDVSKNTALTYLNCSSNALTALDVSKNTALINLYCYNKALTAIDVSNTNKVSIFDVSGKLANIGAANTSATIYTKLNAAFATFADAGTLTIDNTDASAALRATAEAKGWTVTIIK